MISLTTCILFFIATYLHDVSCVNNGINDPYHNRSEIFNPAVEGVCQTGCLPQGAMSNMFCFESFDYAYCAYQATINRHCWPELKQKAQNVLAQLNQAGEFQRCGYNLDPLSSTGFSFDQSRSELQVCYDHYHYHITPLVSGRCSTWFRMCWSKDQPNQTCGKIGNMLSCSATGITSPICRTYAARGSLRMWRKYRENGEYRRCKLGYNPKDESVADLLKDKQSNPMCYNLSAEIIISYSTNGQPNTALKENFWSLTIAVGIIITLLRN